MNTLKGVIAAAATPIKDDLTIDLDHLVRHCAWLLEDGGCDGVNLLGTTGEATSFSAEQRIAAMRAVAASGLPLSRFMVGTGAAVDALVVEGRQKQRAGETQSLRLGGQAAGIVEGAPGCLRTAAALLLPPFYYKGIDAEALVACVSALVGRVGAGGLSLYLYHFPANSGVPYTADAVARLRDAFPDTLKG